MCILGVGAEDSPNPTELVAVTTNIYSKKAKHINNKKFAKLKLESWLKTDLTFFQ